MRKFEVILQFRALPIFRSLRKFCDVMILLLCFSGLRGRFHLRAIWPCHRCIASCLVQILNMSRANPFENARSLSFLYLKILKVIASAGNFTIFQKYLNFNMSSLHDKGSVP